MYRHPLDMTMSCQEIGVEDMKGEIHQAHRLQPRQDNKPPVNIVQFYSKPTRDTWLAKGRSKRLIKEGNKIYFNENLCQQYRHLLREAKLKASMFKYDFVWFKGGRILVKKDAESRNVLVVKCKEDLNKLIQ